MSISDLHGSVDPSNLGVIRKMMVITDVESYHIALYLQKNEASWKLRAIANEGVLSNHHEYIHNPIPVY